MPDESKKVNIDWELIIEDEILEKETAAEEKPADVTPEPTQTPSGLPPKGGDFSVPEERKKEEIKAVSRKKPLRQRMGLEAEDKSPPESLKDESEEELLQRAAEFRRQKEQEAREREEQEKLEEKLRKEQQEQDERAAFEEEARKREMEARLAEQAAEEERLAQQEALKAHLAEEEAEETADEAAPEESVPLTEDDGGAESEASRRDDEEVDYDDDDDEEVDLNEIYPGMEVSSSGRADGEEDDSGDSFEYEERDSGEEESGEEEIPVKEDEPVMDEEDFKDTVEVDLKTVDYMGGSATDSGKSLKSLERKIKDLTERLSDLTEEQEEAFRRISMAVGDSQLAIKSSDRSIKEVRRLKKETEDYFTRAEEQLKEFRDEISALMAQGTGAAAEGVNEDVAERLSVIEDALDRDEEHQKGVLDSLDQLKEEIERLKESQEDLTGVSDVSGEIGRRMEAESARLEDLNQKVDQLKEMLKTGAPAPEGSVEPATPDHLEEKFERLKRKLDEKLDFSDDRIELLKAFVAQNMDSITDQLKWFRQDLTEQLKKIDFPTDSNISDRISKVEKEISSMSTRVVPQSSPVSGAEEGVAEKIAEMESKLELHSDTVLAMEDSLSRLQEKMASRYQEQLNELLARLDKIEKESLPLEYQGRIELLEARVETASENMHLEMEVLAEEIKKDQAELEGAQERINSSLEKLMKKMEVNQDKVKLLVDEKLKSIETRLEEFQQSLMDTRIKGLEEKFDGFQKALPEGLVDKLIPMEETLQELSGTLDSKLDPLRQEIAGAKSHIEKELMKVKESWDKLDQTISDSEGAMTIALRAKESLERIEREVAQAVSRAEAMIAAISENSYKTDSNLEKINLTIKLIDEARDRVKAVQDNIPHVSTGGLVASSPAAVEEDLIFTPREILEDPAIGEIGFSLDDLLRVMMKHEASDLHIKAGAPPTVRLEGELVPVGNQILSEEDCKKLVLSGMSPYLRKQLARRREVDFAYAIPEARFRVNAFLQKQSVSAAFRMLLTDIPDFEELHMPEVMKKLCDFNHGLILITGPAGSGKSTTMASMINYINETRKLHVVTIEDPIEFIHQDKLSIVSQREIGTDTDSFSNALKQSLRQDPNVIMIGEMRDPETIMTAVLAAETGHLVMSSLHTPNTIQSISRIIDVFSGDTQKQFRLLLANNLRGVVSQRLLNRTDGTGRIPAVEVMVVTPTISSLILEEKTGEIYDLMNQGGIEGMQTFTQSLIGLVEKGLVAKDEAMFHADQPTEFRLALEGHTGGGSSMQEDSLMSWL